MSQNDVNSYDLLLFVWSKMSERINPNIAQTFRIFDT